MRTLEEMYLSISDRENSFYPNLSFSESLRRYLASFLDRAIRNNYPPHTFETILIGEISHHKRILKENYWNDIEKKYFEIILQTYIKVWKHFHEVDE